MAFETSNPRTGKDAGIDMLPNKDEIKGKWNQLKGKAKEKFGQLTDDDMLKAEGSVDRMIGVLQERYGYSKERAQSEWNKFMDEYDKEPSTSSTSVSSGSASSVSASSIVDNVKEVASDALTQGKQAVNETLDEVANKADSMVSEQKQQAVRKLQGVSGALRSSSDQLRQDEQETFADYATAAADYVDDFSNFLRNRHPMELWGDVQSFARRQPEVFVLGTLAAGFLLGRFLRSSEPSPAKISHAGQVTPARYLKAQPNRSPRPNMAARNMTARNMTEGQDIHIQG